MPIPAYPTAEQLRTRADDPPSFLLDDPARVAMRRAADYVDAVESWRASVVQALDYHCAYEGDEIDVRTAEGWMDVRDLLDTLPRPGRTDQETT